MPSQGTPCLEFRVLGLGFRVSELKESRKMHLSTSLHHRLPLAWGPTILKTLNPKP